MNDERVVALIDMDCFYVQVEERAQPENKGKPGCVVQYKAWKGGGIIAVNYEARSSGVTRQMRGEEARQKCPDIILYRVPEQRGKADLTKYRDAGKEVIDVLCQFDVCVERASIDEAYLDLTAAVNRIVAECPPPNQEDEPDPNALPNTRVVGWGSDEPESRAEGAKDWIRSMTGDLDSDGDRRLLAGAELVNKMRAAVWEQTGFRCSAGIAHNKMLAKLSCGLYKPNRQTVMPMRSVEPFFRTLGLHKVRHLGGKLGQILIERYQCETMADVAAIPERVLQQRFDEKTGSWLYWYSRGVDHEPVTSRRLPKSIGCNKMFPGNTALDTREKVSYWIQKLCEEVAERLERDRSANQRTAKLLTLSMSQRRSDGPESSRSSTVSRSLALNSYDPARMVAACLSVLNKESAGRIVTNIGVSASKFDESVHNKIDRFFAAKRPVGKPDEESESQEQEQEQDEEYGTADQRDTLETVTDSKKSPSNFLQPLADPQMANENRELERIVEPAQISADEPWPNVDRNPSVSNEKHILSDRKPPVADAPKRTGFFASRKLTKRKPGSAEPASIAVGVSLIGRAAQNGNQCDREPVASGGDDKQSDGEEKTTAADVPKRPGFFLSRLLAKQKAAPAQAAAATDVTDLLDLFPDLDRCDPDPETVALLPAEVRRRVRRYVRRRDGLADGDRPSDEDAPDTQTCPRCGQQVPRELFQEHGDHHVAMDLQKELRLEASSTSSNASASATSSAGPAKPVGPSLKRTLKGSKKSASRAEKRCRTIESFFQPS